MFEPEERIITTESELLAREVDDINIIDREQLEEFLKYMLQDITKNKRQHWEKEISLLLAKFSAASKNCKRVEFPMNVEEDEDEDEDEDEEMKKEEKKKSAEDNLNDLKTNLKTKVRAGPLTNINNVNLAFHSYNPKKSVHEATEMLQGIHRAIADNNKSNVRLAIEAGRIILIVQKKLKNRKNVFARFLKEENIGLKRSSAYLYMKMAKIAEKYPAVQQLGIPLREMQNILPHLKDVCEADSAFLSKLQ